MGDKDDNLRFGRSHTKVVLESGVFKLKFISVKDAEIIFEFLNEEEDATTFAKLMLHHQLVEPDISYEDFEVIPNDEIKDLAREFIKDEYNLAEYFSETIETEFFENFRKAVEDYLSDIGESFGEPIVDISSFVTNYAFSIPQIDLSSIIPSLINITSMMTNVSNIVRNIPDINYSEIISRSAIDVAPIYTSLTQFQSTAINLSQIIAPQIDLWNDWVKKNTFLFNDFIEYWKEFEEKLPIDQEDAIKCLKKYRWFMTPSLPVNFVYSAIQICDRGGSQRKAINHLFVEYFTSNEYEKLIELVEGWKSKELFKSRMKILRDCVNILKEASFKEASPKINAANFVIPTLIAQIDGIQAEFMQSYDLQVTRAGLVNSDGEILKDSDGKPIFKKEWYKNLTSNDVLMDSANDIFLNILFQKGTKIGEPLKTPTFSRHKIMHGEQIRYGRKDNVIRAFLILDFLASLMDD